MDNRKIVKLIFILHYTMSCIHFYMYQFVLLYRHKHLTFDTIPATTHLMSNLAVGKTVQKINNHIKANFNCDEMENRPIHRNR